MDEPTEIRAVKARWEEDRRTLYAMKERLRERGKEVRSLRRQLSETTAQLEAGERERDRMKRIVAEYHAEPAALDAARAENARLREHIQVLAGKLGRKADTADWEAIDAARAALEGGA